MSQSKFIKVGSVLSEFQLYTVESVDHTTGKISVKTSKGQVVGLSARYVDEILSSADYYEKEEQKTVTELANLVISNARVAMTVAFTKKGKELSKKAYQAKLKEASEKFKNAKLYQIDGLVKDLIENPITMTEKGDFREMKGISLGKLNDLGRIEFLDAEDKSMYVPKQVDPRTIQYVILNKVKYTVK